jgi:GGDEF domain-containing protein
VILIPYASERGDQVLANRIQQAITQLKFDLNGQIVGVAASFGTALFPDNGNSEKELVAYAETAISLARQAGKAG